MNERSDPVRLTALETTVQHHDRQIGDLITLTRQLAEFEARRQGREQNGTVADAQRARLSHEAHGWGRTVATVVLVGMGTLLAHGLIAFVNNGGAP